MTLRLNGSTSGYVEIDAPAVAGNNLLKLPNGNGTNGNILTTDGSGNLSWSGGPLTSGTALATTATTTVAFPTGLPSWIKRITVVGTSISTNGSAIVLVQLGTSAGYVTSGYLGGTEGAGLPTNGLPIDSSTNAGSIRHFHMVFSLVDTNLWVANSLCQRTDSGSGSTAGGVVTLPGTLDRVRLATANSLDTFDLGGTLNILYEG